MKIVILTCKYPETSAGLRVKYMVKAFVEEFDADIIVFELTRSVKRVKRGEHNEIVISLGTYVYSSSILRILLRGTDIINKYIILNKIKWYINSHLGKPDLILSTVPPPESVYIGFSLSRYYNAKFMVDFHDLIDEWKIAEYSWFAPFIKSYYNKFVYNYARKSDVIVTTTEHAARILSGKLDRKDIIIVYNGVDPSEFEPGYMVQAKKFRDQGRDNVVVFAGNLNWRYHNLDKFIKAIPLIVRNGFDIKLKIIGEGFLKEEYMRLAQKLNITSNIVFTGFIPRERLYYELGCSDFGLVPRPSLNNLWVLSSDRITLYEYLATGLPIIAYGPPKSYISKVITENNLGIYIPSDNPEIIAKSIIYNIEWMKRICPDNIRKYVITKRCWDKIMHSFVQSLKHKI